MSKLSLQKIIGKGYKEFWETKKRYRIVKGGRGSKKSTTSSLWFIYHIMKYSASNLLVIRKIYKDNKDSTFAQLKWAINRLGVSQYWSVHISPLEIIYNPTGQKIMFRGLDDPMSISSITVETGYLCWVWFEEFYQIKNEQDFNMVDMSIRGKLPDGLFKQITGTLNPWNDKHWIKARFFDNPDRDTFVLTTSYKVNEFLGADDRALFEKMKINNPRRYSVECLGNWGVAEGLVYDNWVEKEFDKDEIIKTHPKIESAFGLDFGYTVDPSAFIASLVDVGSKTIWIFDEFYKRGMKNNDIADMIKLKGYSKEEIVADSSEPKSIDEIEGYGITGITGARKGKDSILNGIQFIQQFYIIVHPKCVNTLFELENYSWSTRNGIMINKPIDDYNHILDALRYSLEKYIDGAPTIRFLT